MKARAAPLRFLAVVTGGWALARAAFLLPGIGGGVTGEVAVAGLETMPPALEAVCDRVAPPARNVTVLLAHASPARREPGVTIALDKPDAPDAQAPVGHADRQRRLASREIIPAPPPSPPRPAPAESSPVRRSSRWSGSAWLFARPDAGRAGLAAGGQLGGSQAGARLAYRLTEPGGGSLALAARISSPLRDESGAEAAIGIDWHPAVNIPFRLSVERRAALGHEGRDAWSAYAAGGFWRGGLPARLEVDGYAQAGVVGARSQDLFADGAVRIGRAIPLSGGGRLVVGAGAWGAAQPRVSRLDIGPRAAVSLPVAGTTLTGAVDWRIRAAGNAAPDSGAAFTLAADF